MTLLPTGMLEKWQSRARAGNIALLENVIEFVDEFYDELKHGELMQAYREGADANFCSEYTFRDRVGLVVRYRKCDLVMWFMNGIGWDHLSTAPSLRPDNPADLIASCLLVGNEQCETMTVREMTNFVLEGENKQRVKARYHFDKAFSKLWKLPNLLRWEPEKAERWSKDLNELIERYIE